MPRLSAKPLSAFRLGRSAFSLFAFLPIIASAACLAAQDLTVDYTGMLFGYYRIEPSQGTAQTPEPSSSAVNTFLQRRVPPNTILLGMGDNYAPGFEASIQLAFDNAKLDPKLSPCIFPAQRPRNAQDYRNYAPEALYKSSLRMPVMVDCDNVSRFLIAAGYRAVVPGREDFIYSASWLRQIGLLFKGASDPVEAGKNPLNDKSHQWIAGDMKSNDKKLHMLAANLRVKLADKSDKEKTRCHLLFDSNLLSPAHVCFNDDPTMTDEMNWLRRVDQSLSPAVEKSLTMQADSDPEFNTQLIQNQQSILRTLLLGYKDQLSSAEQTTLKDIASCEFLASKIAPKNSGSAPTKCSALSLQASLNPPVTVREQLLEIAADLISKIQSRHSAGIPYGDVLLSRPSRGYVVKLLLHLIYKEEQDVGFTIAELPMNQRILIIGVVGQETMQEVSSDNLLVNQIPGVDVPEDSKGPMDAPRPANCPVNPQGISSCGKTPAPGKTSQGIVVVGDPRIIVSDILRAAWEEKIACAAEQPTTAPALFDRVIVMAQMPHTEADELGARVRAEIEKGYRHSFNRPAIDLILSEAQEEHVSPDLKLDFNRSLETPVLTPVVAYTQVNKLNPPTSQVVVSDRLRDPALRQHIENTASNTDTAYSRDQERIFDLPNCKSAACLLESQLERALTLNEVRNRGTSLPESDLTKEWKACQTVTTCEDSVLMQYLLRQIQRSSKADAVVLKRRDFYFDDLGPDNGYNLCTGWVGGLYNSLNNQNVPDPKDRDFYEGYCKLHVALDRVLWKGDYSERVMVDGTTLTTLMSIAQKQTDQDQTLLARDLTGNWLMTYGIVTQPPKNLAAAASGPGSFSVPGLMECNLPPIPLTGKGNSGESSPPYCIDGQSVASDRSYWLSTSDELAEDKAVYSALGNLTLKNPAYVQKTNGLFLTTEIAEEVLRAGQPPSRPAPPPNSPERSLASIENLHQARGLYRIDFTKLVAGYSLTHPSLTDSELADDFAGVSNTQATIPHSQELDLEAATRLTYAPFLRFVTFGIQSDVEYDRKYSGNLTGSPENVAYSANSYTGGGFAQFHLSLNGGKEFARNNIDLGTRNLPRLFIVVAPYQFQSQLAPNYIPFPYYTPSTTPGGSGTFSKTAFLNIQIPVTDGFSQRIGFRFEMSGRPKWSPDPGSYVEIGPEYAVLNNVLAAVRVSGLPVSVPFPTCPVTATAFQSSPSSAPTPGNPLVNCVKYDYQTVNLPLNGSSIIVPVRQTLHAGGFYWSSHVQKNVDAKKNTSLSFDTSGDSFLLPGYTLTTQTRYAFTTKLALNFKIIPSLANLTLSPTYSSFYFENQGAPLQRTSLIASTFSVSAKWYFARDAQVPLWKQSWFQGPASVDQTNSAKIK